MRKLLIVFSISVLILIIGNSHSFANDDDILDFLPAILAGAKEKKPPDPPPYPPGVTVLPTSSNLTDYSGDLLIVGEIYNNTSIKIEYVKITANIFNGSTFVATDYTYTSRDVIPPKTKACFKMYTDYAGPYTKVSFQPPDFRDTSDPIPALSLSNIQRKTDYFGDVEIIGFIKNNSPATVEYAEIIGTFYNSIGKVVDCDYTFANSSTLSPNQSSSFKMSTYTPSTQVSDFALQTDGNLSEE